MNEQALRENLDEVKTELDGKAYVYSTSIWKDRRIYLNLVGANRTFAGDRNLRVFFDEKIGWVYEGFKGTMSNAHTSSFDAFVAEYQPIRR